jgi:polyadenylate-binding protein
MSRKEHIEQLGDAPRKFTNVYVKNFGDDFSDEEMKKLFEPYGEIQIMRIMRTEDGKSRGFGFVSFAEPDSARRVWRFECACAVLSIFVLYSKWTFAEHLT